jgi:D-alanine-D-alanine ligase
VPALLEMGGIAYTGPSPFGHAVSFDRVVVAALLRQAGVTIPAFRVMRWPLRVPADLAFPVRVSARFSDTDFGVRVVRSAQELEAAVDEISGIFERDAFVQDYPEGALVSAALLGNDAEMEWLPLMRYKADDRDRPWIPATLDDRLASEVRELALAAFCACACQDYARVDLAIDRAGTPFVLAVDSMPSLDPNGVFALAALASGCDHAALVEQIVDVAHGRYFSVPAPRFDTSQERIEQHQK